MYYNTNIIVDQKIVRIITDRLSLECRSWGDRGRRGGGGGSGVKEGTGEATVGFEAEGFEDGMGEGGGCSGRGMEGVVCGDESVVFRIPGEVPFRGGFRVAVDATVTEFGYKEGKMRV